MERVTGLASIVAVLVPRAVPDLSRRVAVSVPAAEAPPISAQTVTVLLADRTSGVSILALSIYAGAVTRRVTSR